MIEKLNYLTISGHDIKLVDGVLAISFCVVFWRILKICMGKCYIIDRLLIYDSWYIIVGYSDVNGATDLIDHHSTYDYCTFEVNLVN